MTNAYITPTTGSIVTLPMERPIEVDLDTYFSMLDDLGLPAPTLEVAKAWDYRVYLGQEARKLQREELPGLSDLARQLGRADITLKKALGQFPDRFHSTSKAYEVARRSLFQMAITEATRLCQEALREAGDLLLEGPKQVIAEAVADPLNVDQAERYAKAIQLLSKVQRLGAPLAEGATTTEYLYRDPAAVTAFVREHGRAPSLRDIGQHPEWGCTVLTAEEVLTIAQDHLPPHQVAEPEPEGDPEADGKGETEAA